MLRNLVRLDNRAARDLSDLREVLADGTVKLWRSARGQQLEEQFGALPWLHASRWRSFPGTREFGRRWLASRGRSPADPSATYAGSYRRYGFDPDDAGFTLARRVLAGAGYEEDRGLRSYSVAKDGGPGGSGWMYFVDGIELGDAPWSDPRRALFAQRSPRWARQPPLDPTVLVDAGRSISPATSVMS